VFIFYIFIPAYHHVSTSKVFKKSKKRTRLETFTTPARLMP